MRDKSRSLGNRIVFSTAGRRRFLFLVIILLGHAVAIYVLIVGVKAPRVVRDEEFSALPIYVMSMMKLEREKPRNTAATDLIRVEKPSLQQGTAITIPEPLPESPTTQTPAQPTQDTETTQRDWAREAEKSVQQLGRSTPEIKQFGKTPQEDIHSDDAPGIFDRKSPRRAGYVEFLAPGYERRWLSSRCYREFGAPPSLFAGTGFKGTPVTCLIGSGPPNGHLFDHLKPKYLKEKE